MATMTAYLGWRRETPFACEVRRIAPGVGEVDCFECGGSGDWTQFHPEPHLGPFECVTCKGTGKILIGA